VTRPGTIYAFGPFRLDLEQRLLLRDDKPTPLAPKAILILCVLVENHGRLVERSELMQRVWPDAFVEEGNLTVNIFALRKVLAEGLGTAPAIETIPKRGYRFIPAVKIIDGRGGRNRAALPRKLAAVAVLVLAAAIALWAVLPPAVPRVSGIVQLTRFGLAENIAADGSHLFAGQKMGGRFTIVRIPADGADPIPLALPFSNVRLLDISPGRKEMLVAAFDRPGDAALVWIVPVNGGSPRRFGQVQSLSARWSPNGRRIAYDSGTALYSAAADGSDTRKLAEPGGTIDAWSPDGGRLRFTRTNQATGAESIWEVRADGSGLRPLLPERQLTKARWGEGQCCGRWTPDGRFFVFREAFGAGSSLWAIPERSGIALHRAVKLYAAPFAIRDSSITPDGKRMLVLGSNQSTELVRFDRRLHQWVPLPIDPTANEARWSRDGRWISYTSFPERTLWRVRTDGSERLQLTLPPMQAFGATWSPDGGSLAFHLLLPGKPGKIGVIASSGGKPRVLLADAPTAEDSPSWTPDGGSLLFARYWLDERGETTASAICRFDLATGKVTRLPGTEALGPPGGSPDGRYIAAQSADFRSLLLLDFRSGKWTPIAHGGYIHAPQWSLDSRAIVYQDVAGGEEQPVYEIDLPGASVREIAGRREFLRGDVGRFSLSGLTPDGDPVATVIHSNADIYSLTLETANGRAPLTW
jgi:DNA-binding winged helix-turn-helix (wHTH) protein/Tol biopolymer transport system component